MNDYEYLLGLIKQLKKKTCCCDGDIGITALNPPVDAPSTNGATILVNTTLGIAWYWDGDSWEILVTAVENAAQIKTIEVELSSADIQGMFATPVVVIPGEVGKVHSIIKVISSYTFGGIAYTGGGIVQLTINGVSVAGNLINSSAPQMTGSADVVVSNSGLNPTNPIVIAEGAGVSVTNSSAAYTTGNGTLKLLVTYQTLTV